MGGTSGRSPKVLLERLWVMSLFCIAIVSFVVGLPLGEDEESRISKSFGFLEMCFVSRSVRPFF